MGYIKVYSIFRLEASMLAKSGVMKSELLNKRQRGDSMLEDERSAKRFAGPKAAEPAAEIPVTEHLTAGYKPVKSQRNFNMYARELEIALRLAKSSSASRQFVVQKYSNNLRFMCIAVAVDRQLIALADPSIASHPDLIKLANAQIFGKLVKKQALEPLPVPQDCQHNLSWQSPANDATQRKEFMDAITQHLVQSRPSAPDSWFNSFAALVPKLELELYISASNSSAYSNMSTFQQRIANLYVAMTPVNQNQFSPVNQFAGTTTQLHKRLQRHEHQLRYGQV